MLSYGIDRTNTSESLATEILSDPIGNTAIDFGVYGAPESFLIDRDGIIRYKHIGPLTLPIWTNEIKPLIEELKQ